VLAAAAVVLIPQVPLGLLTTAVQALAGILLPSATVFLLLLCNDREVLGPLVDARWQGWRTASHQRSTTPGLMPGTCRSAARITGQ
jgi:Mn2+/Fe2+ NRAMP family transporter